MNSSREAFGDSLHSSNCWIFSRGQFLDDRSGGELGSAEWGISQRGVASAHSQNRAFRKRGEPEQHSSTEERTGNKENLSDCGRSIGQSAAAGCEWL